MAQPCDSSLIVFTEGKTTWKSETSLGTLNTFNTRRARGQEKQECVNDMLGERKPRPLHSSCPENTMMNSGLELHNNKATRVIW
jgi:hypothetical protein